MNSLFKLKFLACLIVIISLASCGDNTTIESDSDTYTPTTHEQYEEVINNSYQDSFSSPGSSWIKGADYFSKDSQSGTMNIDTDSKKYMFVGVPIDVWKDFKNASSKGSFYHERIKGRYSL